MTTTAIPNRVRTQLALLTDGQLLARFVARGDQAAFAVLVQRHGPMVLGVCRRVLRDDHDTEDAFQAAFVVLARKAGTICKHDSVASWLYKVSYRIALRSRMDRCRRQAQTKLLPPRPQESEVVDVVRQELRQVLDEEVQRLPEKYREPILLCYLQGQTNEEAAALLRCPTGTVKIRLSRGRDILRKRLVKRGLALSATVLLTNALAEMAQSAVPQPLTHAAAQAATGGASVTVAGLARAALKGIGLAKMKVAAVVLMTLGLTCLADVLLNRAVAAPVSKLDLRLPAPEQVPTSAPSPIFASR